MDGAKRHLPAAGAEKFGAKRHLPAAGAENFEGFSHFSLKINTFPLKTSLRRPQTTFKHCKESILDRRAGEGGVGRCRELLLGSSGKTFPNYSSLAATQSGRVAP